MRPIFALLVVSMCSLAGFARPAFADCPPAGAHRLPPGFAPLIAFRLTRGRHHASGASDGHISTKGKPSIYDSEIIDATGTRLVGKNGELIYAADSLPHDLDSTTEKTYELTLASHKVGGNDEFCWFRPASTDFQVLVFPKSDETVIRSSDDSIFVRTHLMPTPPPMPRR